MNSNFNESNTDFILINPNDENRDDHKKNRPPRQKQPNEHTFRKRTIATVLSCVLIGGASGFGGAMIAERTGAATLLEGNGGDRTVSVKNVNTGKKMTAAQVYAKNVDATVGISTKSTTRNMFGYSTESAASGSGFIVSSNGYIVTNYHVIEGADSITVSTNNGKSYEATVRGYNESYDVAVLKINATGLQAVTLGKSADANVGDEVVTIGNPLGELTFSLTSGAISALNREVTFSQNNTMKLIQTEASIDNIGFAIPIDEVDSIIKNIIKNGTKNSSDSSGNSGSNVPDQDDGWEDSIEDFFSTF